MQTHITNQTTQPGIATPVPSVPNTPGNSPLLPAGPPEMHLAESHSPAHPADDEETNRGADQSKLVCLRHYEAIIQHTLGNKDEMAIALLRIHQQKLFKQTHKTLRRYCKERWGFGGSRAYQLIKYAKKKLACMQNGQPPPANERRARQLAGDGTPLKQKHTQPYQRRLAYVLGYLERKLAESFAAETQRFLEDVRQGLDRLEQKLGTKPLVHGDPPLPACIQTQPSSSSHAVTGMTMDQARRLGYVT